MAKLNIEQAHALPLDEVKKRLQELADRLSAKYGIDAKWTSDREASLKRTGVSGTITRRRQQGRGAARPVVRAPADEGQDPGAHRARAEVGARLI